MSGLRSARTSSSSFLLCLSFLHTVLSQTGYEYVLDTEYSGETFFDGWNFFTGGDPTGGFVVYVDQPTAAEFGMINSSATAPAYMGVDHTNAYEPSGYGNSGRPSVRISTQKVWTHGLFIGDFSHAPGGICGTWPAFWTLGPNWPYTGEIDILEGVNLLTQNAMSLHTSLNFTITGDNTTQTGTLGGTNCAFYPPDGNGVGCGVVDTRATSYGTGFNEIGGGIYAMQWTSDFIKVWFFPRNGIPDDITNKTPNPSEWGLPAADLIGPGDDIDLHFTDHAIVFDNTFCGSYAGVVWDNVEGTESCATYTGYSDCTTFVAEVPGAFKDSYWEVNSVRVYQIQAANASEPATTTGPLPPIYPATTSNTILVATPSASAALCPTYNFTEISYGGHLYEIECGYTFNGDNLGVPPGFAINSFGDCISACSYWTAHNETCLGVAYVIGNTACYPKNSDQGSALTTGQYAARLIYAGYGDITDSPAALATADTSTTAYISPTTVIPAHYVNPTVSISSNTLTSASAATSLLGGGGMGAPTNTTTMSLPSTSLALVPTSSLVATSISLPITTSSTSISLSGSLLAPHSIPSPNQTLLSSSTPFLSLSSPSGLTSSSISLSMSITITVPTSSLGPLTTAVTTSVGTTTKTSMTISETTIVGVAPSASPSSTSTRVSSLALSNLPSLPISTFPSTILISISSAVQSPPILSSSTIVALSSPSTSSVPEDGDATNYQGFSSSATPTPSPPPATEYGFAYVGCVGLPAGAGGFQAVETSSTMSIEQCLSDCTDKAFAGMSSQSCYCGNSVTATTGFTKYPDDDCNTACPGDDSETCGGTLLAKGRRRQATPILLLTLYNNTAIINAANLPSSSITGMSASNSSSTSFNTYFSSISSSTISALPISPTTTSLMLTTSSLSSPLISGSVSTTASLSVNGVTGVSSTTALFTTSSMSPELLYETITAGGVTITVGSRQAFIDGITYAIGTGASPVTVLVDAELFSFGPGGVALPTTTIVPYIPTFAISISSSTLSVNGGGFGISSSSPGASISYSASSSASATALSASLSVLGTLGSASQSVPIIISTTYIDVCTICDSGITTMTTTLTTLHCGCTDTPTPTIPMMTTTKACSCGEGGAPSSLVVTCPDTSAIASGAETTTTTATITATATVPASLQRTKGSGPTAGSGVAPASVLGSGNGPLYNNTTAPINITSGTGPPGVEVASGTSSPVSGNGTGTAPTRSGDVPLVTNAAVASSVGGAPLGSAVEGTATANNSVTALVTVGLESAMPPNRSIRTVAANIIGELFAFTVAAMFVMVV